MNRKHKKRIAVRRIINGLNYDFLCTVINKWEMHRIRDDYKYSGHLVRVIQPEKEKYMIYIHKKVKSYGK
jgi:hypothetical protein